MAESQINTSEATLISLAILDEDDAFFDIISTMKEEEFQDLRNRTIFKAMTDFYNENSKAPNASNLVEALRISNKLNEAGGELYISDIVTKTSLTEELSLYRDQVKNAYKLKMMKEALERSLKKIDSGIENIPAFLTGVEKDVSQILQEQGAGTFLSTKDVISNYLGKLGERIEERRRTGKNEFMTGVPTKYATLDMWTKGFQSTDLVILAASPSVGKTAFALNLAENAAETKKTVAFFSLEMTAEQIMSRLLSRESMLTSDEINSLNFTQRKEGNTIVLQPDPHSSREDIKKLVAFQSAINKLNNLNIFINDNPGTTVRSIENEVKKLIAKQPDLGLIVIDYLGLISSATEKTRGSDNRTSIVSDISRALKNMARNLNIPVIALSQLSRSSAQRTDHEPMLSDLRDSGQIEADADKVMMLYRLDYYKDKDKDKNPQPVQENPSEGEVNSDVTLILNKNRNGRIGKIQFSFNKALCKFVEVASDVDLDLPNEEPPETPLPTDIF